MQDVVSTPALRQLMVSTDNKAFYMAVTLKAPAGSPESSEAYQRVSQIIEQTTAGSALTTHVTGEAAVIGDMSIVSLPRYANDRNRHGDNGHGHPAGDLPAASHRIVPLITIAFSVAAAQGVVSALTPVGLKSRR